MNDAFLSQTAPSLVLVRINSLSSFAFLCIVSSGSSCEETIVDVDRNDSDERVYRVSMDVMLWKF